MRVEIVKHVVVPIVIALLGGLAMVGAAYLSNRGFNEPKYSGVAPAEEAKIVSTIADPKYDGFKILKNVRIIDLRGRIPVPPEKKATEKISPATVVNYILMKRLTEKHFVEFEAATTGMGIDARSLTHKYELITTRQPHFHGNRRVKPVVLNIDVSNEPIGREFLIINEMTFWNGFTGEEGDWAAMHRFQNEDIIISVLFPEKKPVKSYEFLEYKQGQEPETFRGRHKSYVSKNGLVLFWGQEELKHGFVYEVKWRW